MSSKKKRNWLSSAIAWLLGLACALVLGFVFYGAMAYQLLDKDAGVQAAQGGEGRRLSLSGAQVLSEQTVVSEYGGETCTLLVRSYDLGGTQAEAITAQPAAYIERLSEEGYAAQLITGFTLGGLDAVYALRGEEAMLCAREGNTVYMLRAKADEQTVYSLGAGSYLE